MEWIHLLTLVHVLSFIFMSIPLFNLILVNERARLGATMAYGIDRYMERVIGGMLLRCYAFQATVLASGLALVFLLQLDLLGNWVLLTKFVLLLVIIGIHNYAYFALQRPINRLLAKVNADPVPQEIASQIRPLRVRRKQLATLCLFLVLTIVLFGLQVYVRFNPVLTGVLIAAIALFAWRAYKSRMLYGWA
jgi:hypothetical protein